MVRVLDRLAPDQARPLAALILCAMACCAIAVTLGGAAALSYSEDSQGIAGLTLQHLRPMHTTFAAAWIFLGGTTIVYFYLFSQGGSVTRGFRFRLKCQLLLWIAAGAGALATLSQGVFSGREYLGGHWTLSVLICAGWVLFAWNFFSVVGFSLRGQPTYVYMWYTSMLLFLWTFAEGHAWHLAIVGDYPLRNVAMQWKSYGPLVGSFNLLVYGSLGYVGCCLARDSRCAYSRTSFMLFYVGVFNSFTNFGHHTYHLPQSHLVKWISCVASLTEVVLVIKYLLDLRVAVRGRGEGGGVRFLLSMTTAWSFVMVGSAVVISVPPLNALIHGTHFVMGHAMGMMLGIDSMGLWAVLLYVLQRMVPESHDPGRRRAIVPVFAVINVLILVLVLLLSVKGAAVGYVRYLGPLADAPPRVLAYFPQAFMVVGISLGLAVLHVCAGWAFLAARWGMGRRPAESGAPT